MVPELVTEVRRLSQEKGLFDYEIADLLDKHRVTITRCRETHGIPRPNLDNREDKLQVCRMCGREEYIPRKQRVKGYCQSCKKIAVESRNRKKRTYMKTYTKKKKHSEGMLQKE